MSFRIAPKRILSLGIQPGLFFVVAVVASWPLSAHIWSAIPSGDSPVGTVPMLNNWILWWNTEFILHPNSYWNAPAFHPTKGAMALSEPQPILILLAPMAWLSGSNLLTYNLYLLVNLTLNGVAGAYFIATIGGSRRFQLVGGILLTIHPLVWHNLEAIQLTVLSPFLLAFAFAIRCATDYRSGDMCRVLVALSIGSLTCLHHTLFAILVLAGTTVVYLAISPGWLPQLLSRWWQTPMKTRAMRVAALFVWLTVLFLAYIQPMRVILERETSTRSAAVTQALSARGADWLSPAGAGLSSAFQFEADLPLSPGILRTLLAVVVVILCYRNAQVRFIGSATLISVMLSYGANLQLGTFQLWEAASETVYGLSSIRSPYRFAYFAQAFILLLATYSLHVVSAQLRLNSRAHRIMLLSMIAVLLVCDSLPSRPFIYFPPSRQNAPQWLASLKDLPEETPVLCLPAAKSGSELALEQDALWMNFATLHKRPILNGYSGFSPTAWRRLRRELNNPDLRVQAVIDSPAKVVVIDRLAPSVSGIADQLHSDFDTIYDDGRTLVLRRAVDQ